MANGQQSGLERFAQGLGKASISFLTQTPQIELDRLELENRVIDERAQGLKQRGAAQAAEDTRQQQLQNLFGIISSPDSSPAEKTRAANAAAIADPGLLEEFYSAIGVTEQADKDRIATRAFEVASAPTRELQNQILQRQIVEGEAIGQDMSDSKRLLEAPDNEFNTTLAFAQAAALTPQQRASAVRGGGSKLGAGVVTIDPDTQQLSFATPVLTGSQVETQQTPISGELVSREFGETPSQKALREIATAGGKTTATAVSKRDQDFIDVGQRQADGTAVLRRALTLLDTIETGGFDAAALAAQNLFGIAGADVTELNNNLGKAVLSQLRTTFGPQFTEGEGQRLIDLEAGFTKSTAGNRRLLKQTLKLMERDARRGIAAARRQKTPDQFSIDEIEKALEFSLDPAAPTDAKSLSDDELLKALQEALGGNTG